MMTNSHYRWVIVAAGGVLGCVAIGAMFSLPVFLLPISKETGWSVTGLSTALTIGFLAMALGSMVWGNLSDRFGPRVVVLAGSTLLALSLALASQATSLLAFQLIFGVALGGAIAAIFAPMMATVTGWFDTHRSLAVSLVSAGMGMAPVVMSPLAAWLITVYDWRTSMLIIAAIAAVVMIPVSFLVRRPPALEAANAGAPSPDEPQSHMSVGEVLKSPPVHHPLPDLFLLLRHPFGPDHPYRQLCGHLRHSDRARRLDLQRGRHRGDVRPHRLRRCRRQVRCEARARHWVAAAGVRRAWLFLRERAQPASTSWPSSSASSTPASCRSTRSSPARISRSA